MGQIIIPTDSKIKGPWLLDKKTLEELHESLIIIEKKLEEAFLILVNRSAESQLDEYLRWDKEMNLEKAKNKVKDSYTFKNAEKYVLLLTKEGKKIKDDSLLSIMKDTIIDEYNPTELRIVISKGPCEFLLEISAKYGGDLEIRVKALDDIIFNDINYEIQKWIDNHKPNLVIQKWSSWFPSAVFLILLFLS